MRRATRWRAPAPGPPSQAAARCSSRWAFGGPRTARPASLEERFALQRRALADARRGHELAAAYAKASRDVASLETKLRFGATQSQLVASFARLAREHGIKIVSETYEETRGAQAALSAELAVQGDYPALRDFLRSLSALPTWSEVQEVRLDSAQGAAGQRGRIRIVTYRQAAAGAEKPS